MATKKNVVEEVKEEIQAPVEEATEVAETASEELTTRPNPIKAAGSWIRNHWKGFLIGAGAAAGAAILAYAKGRDSVIETLASVGDDLDEDESEDDSDVIDVTDEVTTDD